MTDTDMIAMLKAMQEEKDDDVLAAFLHLAGSEICRRAYPFDADVEKVPKEYESLQLEIAAYKLNKRGAEGEKTHNENGVNRTYENASTPESMLSVIVPRGAVRG